MLVEDECQAKSTQRAANTGHGSAWETSQPEQMTGWGLSLQRSPGPEQSPAKEAITAGRVKTTEAASAVGAVRIHTISLLYKMHHSEAKLYLFVTIGTVAIVM